jgi:hypothetical protein
MGLKLVNQRVKLIRSKLYLLLPISLFLLWVKQLVLEDLELVLLQLTLLLVLLLVVLMMLVLLVWWDWK